MPLLGALLVVLGAWMTLSVPVALLAGRFLRVSSAMAAARAAQPVTDDSCGRTAA